ncbi:DNA starvation/stationary phase protection protein [Myroides sp. M-43]|uniref:Dps family protein n=1 Tax=Myroides oncorhynchi TaxID=2893756 RepID=UPI001E59BFBE|nr:DNA starvation/stationary phase protection protein [Myroides oncorhynchi]MCC9042427.1 DNA starvation/stationary phase protection protein [Myroides oncorhynchi]
MKTNIGLTDKARQFNAGVLSQLLADEFILYTKVRNAHYNVTGVDFHSKHVYFEELYTELAVNVDAIAERIKTLGHYAPSSLKDYLKLTHLTEERSTTNTDSKSWISELLIDYEIIVSFIRENIDAIEESNDKSTADFLIGLMEAHEKTAWMLRAHLG